MALDRSIAHAVLTLLLLVASSTNAFSPMTGFVSRPATAIDTATAQVSTTSLATTTALSAATAVEMELASAQLTMLDKNLKRGTEKGLFETLELGEDATFADVDANSRYVVITYGGDQRRYGFNNMYANTAACTSFVMTFEEMQKTPALHLARRGIDRKKLRQKMDELKEMGKEGVDDEYYGFRANSMDDRFYIRNGVVSLDHTRSLMDADY